MIDNQLKIAYNFLSSLDPKLLFRNSHTQGLFVAIAVEQQLLALLEHGRRRLKNAAPRAEATPQAIEKPLWRAALFFNFGAR